MFVLLACFLAAVWLVAWEESGRGVANCLVDGASSSGLAFWFWLIDDDQCELVRAMQWELLCSITHLGTRTPVWSGRNPVFASDG